MRKSSSFGKEFLEVNSIMRKAIRENDIKTIERIRPRFDELNKRMWESQVSGFPELAPYNSLATALQQICVKNGLPFPDLDERNENFTGNGDWRKTMRYIFGVGNRRRSVRIFPQESRGHVSIELYRGEDCYKGQTTSIEESAVVLSRWYVEECSIEELHKQFPWLSPEPVKLTQSRMTFE
jgi:hypothetical protein